MSWLPWVLTAVLLVAFLVWRTLARRLSAEQIAEIQAAVADGARLLDVRTPQEYASGHIDGAVNIPLDELANRVGSLGKRKKPVVIYCATGSRSGFAARLLRQQGFTRVLDLKGIGNHRAVGLDTAA